MGNSNFIPPPRDYRVDRCVKAFLLTESAVNTFWRIFKKHDSVDCGFISMHDYHTKILKLPRSSITDGMLAVVDTSSDTHLSFGEYVELMCTFCCFDPQQLMKFMFSLMDEKKEGFVDYVQFKLFVYGIWGGQIYGNVKDGLAYCGTIDDGEATFTFDDIASINKRFPSIFSPLFRVQMHMTESSLGTMWWNMIKDNIADTKIEAVLEARQKIKAARKKEASELDAITEDMLKKKMGVFYLLTPWRREQVKRHMKIAAAVEQEMDAIQVPTRGDYGKDGNDYPYEFA